MVKSAKTSEKNTRVTKKAPVKSTKRSAPAAKPAAVVTSKKYTNMFAAYRAFWTRGFTDWRGTSSRSEYWWTVLANALVLLALSGVYLVFGMLMHADIVIISSIAAGLSLLSVPAVLLFCIVLIVPTVSMILRRIHDGGFSSWWILLYPVGLLFTYLGFVPYAHYIGYVASLILFVMMLLPTRVDGNPYHKYNK